MADNRLQVEVAKEGDINLELSTCNGCRPQGLKLAAAALQYSVLLWSFQSLARLDVAAALSYGSQLAERRNPGPFAPTGLFQRLTERFVL
jgi:hypothetical protein